MKDNLFDTSYYYANIPTPATTFNSYYPAVCKRKAGIQLSDSAAY